MAETPFSPESGATIGGSAPEDGTLGSSVQPSPDDAPETAPAAMPEAEAAPELVSDVPVPSEPVAAPEPAAAPEVAPATSAFSAVPPESAPAEPAVPPPSPAEEPVPPPGVAATITVPPLDASDNSGGGEWELLVERFNTWWSSGELNRQWQRIRGPLKGVAILLAVVLALQLYATVVRTVDAIPLVSGLLELTGLIFVLQFSATRLLRSSDRREVLEQLQGRWLDFRGRN